MDGQEEAKRKAATDRFLDQFAKKCRIGGFIDGKRSPVWTIASRKRDLYIGQESTGRFQKISLHESGRFRLAFQNDYHQGLIDAGIVDPGTNRAITLWDRPAGDGRAAQLVVSILLPALYYETDFDPTDFDKATNLFTVASGNALEIGIFLSERYSDDLEGKLETVGLPVWYADLKGAGTFSVVIRQRAFEPKASLPKPMTVPSSVFHDLAQMPTDEAPVRTGLRALLYNDPVAEGLLRVIDVGGITLTKNVEPAPRDTVAT